MNQICVKSRGKERLAIIEQTYKNAVASGDKNVYFIPRTGMTKYAKCDGTVDNSYPNDFGFASMAQVVGDFIEEYGLLDK